MSFSVSKIFLNVFVSAFIGAFLFSGVLLALEVKDDCFTGDREYDLCLGESHFLFNQQVYYSSSEEPLPDVDLNSFEEIDWLYAIDGDGVYYTNLLIPEADPGSFEILEEDDWGHYSMDDDYVFFKGVMIEGADPSSFELIGEFSDPNSYLWQSEYLFSKDAINVFMNGEIVKGANAYSFERIGRGYFKDEDDVFYFGELIEGADPNEFSAFGRFHAKDSENVYYQGELIEGADPTSYKEHGGNYFSNDKNFVYYKGEKIKGSDGSSFEFFLAPDYQYARDKNQVYLNNSFGNTLFDEVIVKAADPDTFQALFAGFYRDKDNIFVGSALIEGGDPNSLRAYEGNKESQYYLDNNHVYYNRNVMLGADPDTFQKIYLEDGSGSPYSRDKDSIFYRDVELIGTDVDQFKIFGEGSRFGYSSAYFLAGDLKKLFINDVLVEGGDPNTVEILGSYFRDKNSYFYNETALVPNSGEAIWVNAHLKAGGKIFYRGEEIDVSDYDTFMPIMNFTADWEGVDFDSVDKDYVYKWGEKVMLNPQHITFSFTDIYGQEYFESVNKLSELGIVKGYEGGEFGYKKGINRAEFLKLVFESRGITINEEQYGNCFPDVNSEWFAGYVCYGKELGVVNGHGDGFFRPADPVSYPEALKILFEAYGIETDQTDGEWYYRYLNTAGNEGLGIGLQPDKFGDWSVERGEMAELIVKFMEY